MMIFIGLMLACGKDTDTDEEVEETEEDEIVDTSSEDEAPQEPEAFSLTITGLMNETLLFDNPTCQIPDAAPNINIYWRNQASSHKFVFRMMLRNDYDPAVSDYNNESNNLSFTLQEEAGGSGRYFATDFAAGDQASLALEVYEEIIGEPTVWGNATVATMRNPTDGSITISPSIIPVWCTPENTN